MTWAGAMPVDRLERETMMRVAGRLLPLLMICYFIAYLDRVNVGFAALTMNKALGFSAAVFGLGGGIFFVGYFLFEVPSNLILSKVGARSWIARILTSWGLISALTAFVWNEWSFYAVRFLLGLAEAGFYPGIILYLTWWFPSAYRSRIIGVFMTAIPISVITGSIVSSQMLRLDGWLGMAGWQWLFIIEAISGGHPRVPRVVLPDRHARARPLVARGPARMADAPACHRAGAARSDPSLRTRRDPQEPACLAADPGLFRSEHVRLRPGPVPSADHQQVRRIAKRNRADNGDPLCVWWHSDGSVGPAFRPHRRAAKARRGILPGGVRGSGGMHLYR